MTEFAVVAPVLILMLFGVLEGALLMFSVGSARFAAQEAAKTLSEEGNVVSADADAIAYVQQNTPIGTTGLLQVNEIDFYLVVENSLTGALAKDTSSCSGAPCLNRYNLDGTPVGGTTPNWPSTQRDVSAFSGNFVGVDVKYTYHWKEGLFSSFFAPVSQTSTVWIRVEPQAY